MVRVETEIAKKTEDPLVVYIEIISGNSVKEQNYDDNDNESFPMLPTIFLNFLLTESKLLLGTFSMN